MLTMRRSLSFLLDKSLYCKRLSFYGRISKCGCSIEENIIACSVYPLQIRFFITSKSTQNLHTTKGWKSLARNGQKEEILPYKPPVSCEEGTGAVPHLALMNQLQNCNKVSDQIKTFCSTLSLRPEDVENRKEFCKSLTEILSPYFGEFKIHLFGSSINGLGFKGCDVDVSIQTIFDDDKECMMDIKQVPTLDSVIQGETSLDTIAYLPPRLLLRFVRRILRKHCSDVKEPILLIKARCSLLRFYNSKYDLFCDFSYETYSSLRNTKLIRLLCHLDERFEYLAKFIRYWGKYGGFVGDMDMFNSYAFSLLVVNFLQQRDPPILPPIQELIDKSEYLTHGDIHDDELLLKDVKKFQRSQNTQTLEELTREYFFYYLTFDYSHVMRPVNTTIVSKIDFRPKKDNSTDIFEFSTVTVQDPFRSNFNVTMAANYKHCKRFLNGLVEACSTYQDASVWNSDADKWGICSLFNRTVYEAEMLKKWQENCIHNIKLPLQVNVNLVKEIFEQCLLFNCTEMFSKHKESPLLRLYCKVFNNTWQGRDLLFKSCPQTLTNHLDIENWVSNEMLKKKEDNRKVRFTFMCDFFENRQDEELNIVLTFQESKYPPIVAIFLKEYVPSICTKLMK